MEQFTLFFVSTSFKSEAIWFGFSVSLCRLVLLLFLLVLLYILLLFCYDFCFFVWSNVYRKPRKV